MANDLAAKGHKHFLSFVHRFGETGAMGQMDCVYSAWLTRRDQGFGEQGMAALRDLGRTGRRRAHVGPGLSRARRLRTGVAWKDLAGGD